MKEAGIGIVFRKEKQEVLLIKRTDIPIFVLPGGGIEAGETPEEACIREVFEETGLEVRIKRKIGCFLPINRLSEKTYVFECEPVIENSTQELSPQLESEIVAFYPLDNLPSPFFFLHKEWIEEALMERFEPVTKKMANVTYVRCLYYILRHPIFMVRYFFSRKGK